MRESSGLMALFVERRPFYTLAAARRLAHMSVRRLQRAMDEGAVEPVSDGTSLLLAWEDVVALVLERWTPRQIAQILRRAGHPHALSPLNELHTIEVELPLYQIRLLHYLAERRSARGAPPLAVSDVLEYELSALAFEEDLAAIDRAIPGLAAAANDPLLQDRPQLIDDCCVFCGAAVATSRKVCPECIARHVPAG
jgi:hypothetical protein